MSASPYSCSTMEPTLGSTVCLICFEMTEKHIFVPSDAPEKLFMNCTKYLHSTLTKGTLKDIKLHNENQVPLCKSCFDSALELTQLSEQFTTIQKDISDLTVAFSMAVFHRRSQVYSIGQSCKTSSIVEFNEACLPPNLFSMNLGDQNIHPNKTNQELDINDLHLQIEISSVKCEASDIQLDIPSSGNPQSSVAKGDKEIQFNEENLDKQCRQSTIGQNQNFESVNEMKIVDATGDANDSKKRANLNNGLKCTTSDLLKSVKMPKIILERIKIDGYMLGVSVGNSSETNFESTQKNLDETLINDDEFSVPTCAQKSPEDGKLLTCFSSKNTFPQESHETLLHKTHTGKTICKRPLGKRKYVFRNNQKICQITPTGEKTFYKCSYCEKTFARSDRLIVHERIHTGEKPYKCSFCNFRFNNKGDLKKHERKHTGEKPFKCSFCNNSFKRRTNLKNHERIHTGEKPFKCSFCNKQFRESRTLKCHERTHTGEKPFKCSYCEQSFPEKYTLKFQERLHHIPEEKPYNCLHCKKTFSQRSDKNKNSHQKCDQDNDPILISNQKEGSLGQLEHQKKINSVGHMEFKCSFCEMTFNHGEERANHEKIHRREDEIANNYLIVGI